MNRLTCSFKHVLIASGLAALTALSAQGQTTPVSDFQINGNAANNSLQCEYGSCDYWNLLNGTGGVSGGPGNNSAAGHSLVRTFINGLTSTDSFTGGGSKDSNLLSQWAYSTSPTPNKDTLNAGYAAAYKGQNGLGDFLLMFGADRASPSGNANIGIWFFQQSVSLNGAGGFAGAHTDHDIFIISAFTGGGGTSTISVYEWDHTCSSGVKNPTAGQCSDTNLRLLAVPGSVCGASIYCAVTNAATTNTTWEGNLSSPLFFEGGINLTKALAAVGVTNLPCFSSFLEETRSSQSTTAVLKDFVIGGFPVCSLNITKACDATNQKLVNGGTQVQFAWKGSVTNTGVGTLNPVTINDAIVNGPTLTSPTLTDSLGNTITSLDPGQTGNYAITYTSSNLTETNTATAVGFFGTSSVTSNTASSMCTQNVSSALTVTKSCVAPGPAVVCPGAGGACTLSVPVQALVCNTGQSQVTGITLTDSTGAKMSPNGFTLGPNQCTGDGSPNAPATPIGSYTPTSATTVNGGASGGRYTFGDTINITGATATLGTLSPVDASVCTPPAGSKSYGCSNATCPLCGSGECVLP